MNVVSGTTSVLRLIRRRRTADGLRVAREHLDFLIDGVSLVDRVSQSVGYEEDLVTVLNDFADAQRASRLAQLIGTAAPELSEERSPLLECPECGAVECGVVSAVIERTGDRVIWRDFGYEPADLPSVSRVDLIGLGPFEFDETDYSAQFASAAAVLSDMPPRAARN